MVDTKENIANSRQANGAGDEGDVWEIFQASGVDGMELAMSTSSITAIKI
jgi:hypothetical protein